VAHCYGHYKLCILQVGISGRITCPSYQLEIVVSFLLNNADSETHSQIETSILASAATDRSIVLYDLRTSMELSRTVLSFASNSISWNPMEGK
jgi:hypothetical protein